ncbi:MAG: Hint domain-containing protein [Pseudomonadota bacterium]
MGRTIVGVFRSDTGLGPDDLPDGVGSFSSNLITSIFIDDEGASTTLLQGDSGVNETPDDPTQQFDDGSGLGAIAYDFTTQLIGSNGVTYDVAAIDYDLNNDGNFGDGTRAGADPGENNYFFAFLDTVPPPGITLSAVGGVTDNSPSIPFDDFPVCFCSGTRIDTPSGPVLIEDLNVGALVTTQDHGYQRIRWIGRTTKPATGKLAPIVIRAGALGNSRDLWVSPQHRILISGWYAELLFGDAEVLVPAVALLNDQSITRAEGGYVTYHHMMFDDHQIVFAEGTPTESFYPGKTAMNAIEKEAKEEIFALFPDLLNGSGYGPLAAASIRHKDAKALSNLLVHS